LVPDFGVSEAVDKLVLRENEGSGKLVVPVESILVAVTKGEIVRLKVVWKTFEALVSTEVDAVTSRLTDILVRLDESVTAFPTCANAAGMNKTSKLMFESFMM